jgi:hypothetical protein
MHDRPFEVEEAQRAQLTGATQERLGCALKEPFLVLSFVGLPTVPEFGLSDMGLIELAEKELVSVVQSYTDAAILYAKEDLFPLARALPRCYAGHPGALRHPLVGVR